VGDQVLLLILGFVLTTVVGGVLGYYYQRRTWDANRRESERTAAGSVFDEISRAMDERLYRMRLVYWSLKQRDEDRILAAMAEYRGALIKWNDNLNRNLALAFRYFGRDVWAFLSGVLYEEFAIIGRHLEDRYRHRGDKDRPPDDAARLYVTGRRMQALSNDIYDLNRFIHLDDPTRSGWPLLRWTGRRRAPAVDEGSIGRCQERSGRGLAAQPQPEVGRFARSRRMVRTSDAGGDDHLPAHERVEARRHRGFEHAREDGRVVGSCEGERSRLTLSNLATERCPPDPGPDRYPAHFSEISSWAILLRAFLPVG
jgi:hypothetical protein